MFRSVRDLEVHICMRSSDATCCASMAVNLCFFSFWCATPKIRLPGAPKLGAELIFMSKLGRHPDWHSIIIRTPPNSFSKMSKTGKNVKNPLYIRYNLKIRYIKKVKNRFSINWECCGQFDTLRSTNACVVPMLHAVKVALPVFRQQTADIYRYFLLYPL